MTRALIDINQETLKKLDEIANIKHLSRAAVVRVAIDEFLQKNSICAAKNAFGILKQSPIDGLSLQEKLRGEW